MTANISGCRYDDRGTDRRSLVDNAVSANIKKCCPFILMYCVPMGIP